MDAIDRVCQLLLSQFAKGHIGLRRQYFGEADFRENRCTREELEEGRIIGEVEYKRTNYSCALVLDLGDEGKVKVTIEKWLG